MEQRKNRINRIMRKLLGKSGSEKDIVSQAVVQPVCVGNVDFFEYKNSVLYAEGWVFDTLYDMQDTMIAFYQGKSRVGEISPSLVYRSDVADVLKNTQAESSGFFFEATVNTAEDMDVFFEYSTKAGIGKFFLGNIPGNIGWSDKPEIISHENMNCLGNIRYVSAHYEKMKADSRAVRLFSVLKQCEKETDTPVILAFDHFLGGGASAYLEEKKKKILEKGHRFLTLKQDVKGPTYYLFYEYKDQQIVYYERRLEDVLQQIGRVDEIWVNELVTYSEPYGILQQIISLKEKHNAYLKMLLHDYYAICPAVNLLNDSGVYCKGAPEWICDKCIPNNRSNACPEYESGSVWRKRWRVFLDNCDEIRAFSEDTARLFRQVYPGLANIRVVPHKSHDLPVVKKIRKTTDTFNIGLLGVLCYKKGLEIVKQLIQYIEKEKMEVRVKLIGLSDEEIDSPVFSWTGRYQLDQLPQLTLENDIDMFLIPSICPETFSYTTSEIISMDMPVAVFAIGAPAERVKEYDKGLILSGMEPETMLSEMQIFAGKVIPYMEEIYG